MTNNIVEYNENGFFTIKNFFTKEQMDLVKKDMTLFDELSKKLKTPLEISPFVLNIFDDAEKKYGPRAWSSMVVKRFEDKYNLNFRAPGYPEELVDNEEEEKGYEI